MIGRGELNEFAITALSLFFVFASPAQSQTTVGNGTYFVPPAGAKESYGINASQDSTISYPSRHIPGASGSGIGSSFIGTTSPTSESSPATSRAQFVADTTQQFHLPKLDSPYSQSGSTPALQMFNPAVPKLPQSRALDDPWANSFMKANTFQPLEELPSFSKKRSVTDLMRF